MALDGRLKNVRLIERAVKQCATCRVSRELDALENSLDSLRSKFWQLRETSVDSNRFEIVECFDPELLMEHVDFCTAEPGNAKQVEKSARRGFLQSLEVARLAGLDQL